MEHVVVGVKDDILGVSRIQKFLDTYTDMHKDIPQGTYHIEHRNSLGDRYSWSRGNDDSWRYALVLHTNGPTINWNQILQMKHQCVFYSEDMFISMIPITKIIVSTDYMWRNMLYGKPLEEVLMLLNMG